MFARGCLVALVVAVVFVAEGVSVAEAIINVNRCNNNRPPPPANSSQPGASPVRQTVKLWQAVVLLLCMGAFSLFVCLLHRIIRTYIYYDGHLLDTFFDGGGDTNATLVAVAVVARSVWPSTFSQPVNDVREVGLVGHFWYAAALAIHLFLFSIVAAEIRIKAPGAKTYLQVIYARYGACAHTILMVFALICNIMVIGMVMLEGSRMVVSVTEDLSPEVAAVIMAVVVGIYTVVGGVGGTMYVAYFMTALFFSVALLFVSNIFWDPMGVHVNSNTDFGSISSIYKRVDCGRVSLEMGNEQNSPLTFVSRQGMIQGILFVLAGFSSVFVNQSFWQVGMAAKPSHAVWGFITGGLTWFALPFALSLAMGMAYWVLSIREGDHTVTDAQAITGVIPMYVGQTLMGTTGTFLMISVVMAAVISTASSEVLSVSSIIIYDIYQTYISPFKASPVPVDKQMSVRMQQAIRNEEYLEYDRRSVWLKHVVVISVTVLLIPIALVVLTLRADVYWLFMITGIVCGGCVIPIALAITWHRTTAGGVVAGSIGGLAAGIICWLALASVQPGGLQDFRNNTAAWLPLMVALASSLGVGALLCVFVSISCGGCDSALVEEEEWEKTRQIDNPILPWSIKYAPDIGATNMAKGRPHYYTVRRTFKASEVGAYILGVLLTVCAVLVWPASMLPADVFSEDAFSVWVHVALVWGAVSTCFALIVPLVWEIVQNCRQAYYNRMWAHSDKHGRLEEEPSSSEIHPATAYRRTNQPQLSPQPMISPASEVRETDSDFQSNSGAHFDPDRRERWKTFIHLE